MVGEFPELQGIMGGYYARAQGLPDAVADAIRDHYKPVGQGDEVPTAPVTVAVSLADKLDSLIRFFSEGELPTGSKDPFALRRATLASIRLLLLREQSGASLTTILLAATLFHYEQALENQAKQIAVDVYFGLRDVLGRAPTVAEYEAALEKRDMDDEARTLRIHFHAVVRQLLDFFADRLKVQQREAGVRHDLIDAVFALGGEDDLVRLLARVHALQAFVGTEDGANLLAGYKRAANILKKENWQGSETRIPRTGEEDPLAMVDDPDLAAATAARMELIHSASHTLEPAEAALVAALDRAEPAARDAVAAEDFAGAMAALSALRAPIDAFFEDVTVNDADANKRRFRLDLLMRFRDAVQHVADFSRIVD